MTDRLLPGRSSETRLRLLVLLAGVASLILLMALGALQWRQDRNEDLLRAEIVRSHERQRLLSDYLGLLQDAETGQRGYLVTGNPDFLQPFDRAKSAIAPTSMKLEQSFAGTSGGNDVHALQDVGARRLEHARAAVEAWRAGRHEQALAWIRAGGGKRLMDEARVIEGRLVAGEDRHSRALLLDTSAARSQQQTAIFITQLALLIALLVMVVSLVRMVRHLELTGAHVRDAATRQAAIFEGATDAMMMLDKDGTIEATNAAAERLFGRGRADMIGQSNLVLFKDPPAEEVSRGYLKRLASQPELGGNSQDFLGLRADGSEVETEVVTTPIRLQDGLHYLAVARDATERRRVERLKTEFVATVSHELRTPLTSIAGALGLLSGGAGGELDPKAHRLITIAHNNSERLVRLINDILDIEKIQSGNLVLDLQPVPLTGLIEQVTQANEAFADQHGVRVEVEAPRWEPVVIADRDRLMQVLTNLLSNAIKFSRAGGVVAIRVRPSGPSLRLSVSDAGDGIPDAFRSRIFSKFAQADSTDTRQKGGTGLGLSIAKELVDRMNGRIWFETTVGEGTTFHVELPALQALPPGDDHAEAVARAAVTALPQVLHVDDDTDMLRLVASALEGRIEVHSTPSVAEAEAALRRYRFDAVILDIGMADGNGLDLVPVARATNEDTCIVLFTAQDVGDSVASGVDSWLTKSKVDLGVLTRTILETLGPKDKE